MKPHRLLLPAFFLYLIITGTGCTSSEIGQSKDVAQETIYQQYHISYNEAEENATVLAQFRFAGDKGTTLVLNHPSSVQFDGFSLTVDSSDFEGAFYKKSVKAANFYGNHQFRFTDINKKKYNNDFSFDQFKLINIPESASRNQDLRIQFEPLLIGRDDYIEIGAIETDSTFNVIYDEKDSSEYITIPLEALQRQKGEQIKFTATLHKKCPLQQNSTEGGILEMEYAVKPFTIRLR